jgi:hypothetical protein
MREPTEILNLYRKRKASYALLHSKMREIADIYNGRAEVPLPELERDEMPSIPNLLAQGVDQMAGRITSVVPTVTFASARPGIRKSDRNAQAAADTVTGWWQADRLMMKQKSRGRRLIAYGMAPTVLRWDHKNHRPTWQVRHPMETLPSPDLQPGQVRPSDCIFSYTRSIGWLTDNGYGEDLWILTGGGDQVSRDTLVTIIEYIDADHTVLMAAGHYGNDFYGVGDTRITDGYANSTLRGIVLEAYPNMSTDIPVVIPTRLTLDEMTGQFDNMIGMYYAQAKLMALEVIAVEKGIFPDTYIVSRQGEQGRFIEGPHDGRTGMVNVIAGGDIKEMQTSPGYMTQQTIDRLERAQRVTSGIPAEFGGESGSNIRTGRRGDAVLSAVIDFPVAEAQETFAFALEEENRVAIQMAKRIDGDTKRTIYVGVGNARKPVDYVPNETFSHSEHVVAFPATGTDLNTLIIGLGQRVGLGIMSKQTAAQLDPFVDNPEHEHDAIIAEGLEQALVQSIQQQAASGQLPPITLSKVMRLVRTDKMELAEALTKVTEDAQKAQAQPPPPGEATPDDAAAGATMAAMTGGVPSPEQTMPGMGNLGDMLGQLRRPAMTIQPMRGAERGAV